MSKIIDAILYARDLPWARLNEMIEGELDAETEREMRRWWRHKCVKHVKDGEVFFEVGSPVSLNIYEGIKRFASFGIKARAVNR